MSKPFTVVLLKGVKGLIPTFLESINVYYKIKHGKSLKLQKILRNKNVDKITTYQDPLFQEFIVSVTNIYAINLYFYLSNNIDNDYYQTNLKGTGRIYQGSINETPDRIFINTKYTVSLSILVNNNICNLIVTKTPNTQAIPVDIGVAFIRSYAALHHKKLRLDMHKIKAIDILTSATTLSLSPVPPSQEDVRNQINLTFIDFCNKMTLINAKEVELNTTLEISKSITDSSILPSIQSKIIQLKAELSELWEQAKTLNLKQHNNLLTLSI